MNKYEKYYESIGNYLKDINHANPEDIGVIPKSASYISPGDVLSFSYPGSGRVYVFVVKVKRGNGMFLSSQGNKLVACFKLTTTSPEISSKVLKTLYKNRRSASYDNVSRGLLAIFGPNSFRTYNLANVTGLAEILIQPQKLPSLDDED
jgi:hypothetical protein